MGYFYSTLKKVAYKALHIVTLGNGVPARINNFKLKLPTKYFRLFPKNYEPSSFEFFKKHAKAGATVLDIGAHIGLYSVFFYKITKGKIYSFEPTPSTVEVLKKTIQVNDAQKNVTIVQAAVAEKPGVATFYSNDLDASQSNSLVDLVLSDSSNRKGAYQVNVLSIDQFRVQEKLKIDVLKIDAEGVELDVLKGAKDTFLQDRPVAVLGLHPFAYQNRQQMLETIWNILMEYKMQVQSEGNTITKEQFCSNPSPVFDVELLPQ